MPNKVAIQNIVVADDDPVVRHILSAILVDAGYTVEVVESGKGCIELVEKKIAGGNPPAALFLDLFLADMTGTKVLEHLQKKESGQNIPAIMLSANSREEAFMMSDNLRVDFFLQKPFEAETVLSILKSALAQKNTLD